MTIDYTTIEVGAAVPPLIWQPTREQLFRFSAVTWNAHRIHYDRDAAIAEGHLDVVVQAHLHGAMFTRMLNDWMGPRGRLLSLSWQNRWVAVPGNTLTCRGHVVEKRLEGDACVLELELSEINQADRLCVSAKAVVALPLGDGTSRDDATRLVASGTR